MLLQKDDRFELRIAGTGQHLRSGSTSLAAIEQDGFKLDFRVEMDLGKEDDPAAIAEAMGKAVAGAGRVLNECRPDLMLVLGDRYEILGVACAAILAKVPIAHLCGGDVTEGAIDDAMRHAITKLSSLHFVSNAEAGRRVLQLGENPDNVFNAGSPGLDRIRNTPLLSRNEFFAEVGLEPRARNFLITVHPSTLADKPDAECCALLAALAAFAEAGLIFTRRILGSEIPSRSPLRQMLTASDGYSHGTVSRHVSPQGLEHRIKS